MFVYDALIKVSLICQIFIYLIYLILSLLSYLIDDKVINCVQYVFKRKYNLIYNDPLL